MTKSVLVKGSKITIGGFCGTGKGTVSEKLATALGGYKVMSAGGLFRGIADEMSIPLAMLEEIAKEDSNIDARVDEKTREFGLHNDYFVFEGRLGWNFIKDGVNILLTCNYKKRILRVAKREGLIFQDARNATDLRERAATKRYVKHYGIADISDPQHYTFVVDTTNVTADEVVNKIIAFLKLTGKYRPMRKH